MNDGHVKNDAPPEQPEPQAPNGQSTHELGPTDSDQSARASASQPAEDEAAAEEAPEQPEAEPSLEEKLAQAEAEIKAIRERMLRVAADFDNFRKRSARDVEDARRRGTQSAVRELLPVFDNLERAITYIGDSSDAQSIADGVRMVIKMFLDTLGKLGVERVEALGRPFDPTVHEGMQHAYSDEHDAGAVMQELLPGYRMGSELLRPALVVVSKGPAPEEQPPSSEESGPSDEESAEQGPAESPPTESTGS